MSLLANLKGKFTQFWDEELHPFIKNLLGNVVHAEVQQLTPIVANLIASEEANLVKAAASGSLSDLAESAGMIAVAAAKEAETQGITAGISSLLTTVSAAISSHPAVVDAAAAPAPAVETEPAT